MIVEGEDGGHSGMHVHDDMSVHVLHDDMSVYVLHDDMSVHACARWCS